MKISPSIILFLFVLSVLPVNIFSQEDNSHFSDVFNREKPYRIFLPDDYSTSGKSYPVIYYFHGNKGSHVSRLSDVLAGLVKEQPVIIVAWNGRSVDSDIRPYNIGFHSNINYETQFKDYFPELVHHIDSHYRTLTDRSNRAIIGHSMGGIMSFFIAGKYPQLVGSAVNSKGSPEFFIGYPENHTLYCVRYLFKNLHGVNLRFHNSTTGELVYLNDEVHAGALQEGNLAYEYQVYEGGHSLMPRGLKDAFDFVVSSFNNPNPAPERWHHADLYPDFEVWGYEVESDLDETGYIEMRGVTKQGMGITTRKWQPHGRIIPGVAINVKTPPLYEPNSAYTLLDFNKTQDIQKLVNVVSDEEGKISFSVNHESHQIGIYRKRDPAEVVYVSHKVNDENIFLDQKGTCKLKLRLLNRGGSNVKNLKVELSCSNSDVSIANPVIEVDELVPGEPEWIAQDFTVTASNPPPANGAPFRLKFHLSISDNKHTWRDEFEAPVMFDVPEFTNIGIDDGDSEIFGSGNGNNIAEPGESIMIYEVSHRTRLYYDDPYIGSERIHVDLQPDKWGDGYAVSSVIHISEDCPMGHQIKFLASYEVKEWKTIKRNVTWGTFTITIGKEADDLKKEITLFTQGTIDAGDPPNNTDIPDFYKSKLADLEDEVNDIENGEVEIIATSPGGFPVYAIYYGEKENFQSQANYNSAVAARDPAFYAKKDSSNKPVVFFLGPVHGQEVEGMVGLVNLIHVAETGRDHRGKEWSDLKSKIDQCRVIIVPCGNPDGRRRCPYDSFVGLPSEIMTKYGQGTRTDGSSWGWPMAKSVHPMKGNVGILGAYFNDDGINMMHDDFFSPMATETEAILDIARSEVPDMTVSLHSHENRPRILPANYVPWFMKERVDELTRRVNSRYEKTNLPYIPDDWISDLSVEDQKFPPHTSFNLISALHHISGTMAFTFECSHGSVPDAVQEPFVTHGDILDIQLILYEEMLDYLLENRLNWE